MLNKYSKAVLIALLVPAMSHASDDEHHDKHQENHGHDEDKIEKIQVTASRLGRIVTESATRTEIINGEEIQEMLIN